MSRCIWIHYARPRPHWYALGDAVREAHEAKWRAEADKSVAAGGDRLGRYHVRGQHDFETVEIWRFANPEAAFAHWSALISAGYGDFNAFANNIGLSIEGPS